jgi:acyl carrier protein
MGKITMDKLDIVDIVHNAIHNISPFAHERLLKIENNRDIYLVDLGINSIDYVSILYDVSDVLSIELTLEEFS